MVKRVQGRPTQWYCSSFRILTLLLVYLMFLNNQNAFIFLFTLSEIHSSNFFFFFLFSQTGPNAASKENWGVNYRALSDLFSVSQTRRSTITYEIRVQMVEIYNEQVRDLLSSDGSQKKYPFFLFLYILLCKQPIVGYKFDLFVVFIISIFLVSFL